MKLAVLASAILVGACAPSLAGSNERGGVISNHGWSQTKSFEMAEAHCKKYGRHARTSGTNDLEAIMRFDCVE